MVKSEEILGKIGVNDFNIITTKFPSIPRNLNRKQQKSIEEMVLILFLKILKVKNLLCIVVPQMLRNY